MANIPVALQMYTVRDESAKDFVGTLRKVAEIGYAGVELAGTGGLSAKELKEVLDDLGLQRAGNHTGMDALRGDLQAAIEFNLEFGNPYVVLPSLPGEWREDGEGFRSACGPLNEVGAACKKNGLTFCYHNHSFEFQKFDGKYGLDILYEGTDPELVKGEVDTYWVQHGGEDPAAYIRKYAGRCPLIHLKDMEDAPDRAFTEVGNGILDFEAIFAASEAGGAEWYIVEQDTCKRPSLESARISFENLKKMGIA